MTFCGLVFSAPRTSTSAAKTSGNWVDHADGKWLNTNLPRYSKYPVKPGSDKDHPYVITSAAELAYLNMIGSDGSLAGKYIKLGPDCFQTLNEIDLSAHYWTPVNLYGSENGSVFLDDVAAHIDGNHVAIKGMKIYNTYTEANKLVFNEAYDAGCGDGSIQPGDTDYLEKCEYKGGFTNGAAVGLFGEVYKAQVTNFKLVAPEIIIDKQTDICSSMVGLMSAGYSSVAIGQSCNDPAYKNNAYWLNTRRIEIIGSLIGTARYSMIIGNSVSDPNIDIKFDPATLSVGGLVGYLSGFNYLISAHSAGGHIAIEPRVNPGNIPTGHLGCAPQQGAWPNCYIGSSGYSYRQYASMELGINIGGLVGDNYHSAIMNGFSSTKIDLDATKITDDIGKAVDAVKNISGLDGIFINEFGTTSAYGYLYIGGLVGRSDDIRGIAACILNSYSSSDIDIKMIDSVTYEYALPTDFGVANSVEMRYLDTGFDYARTGIGGIAGYLYDTAVNTYYAGKIRVNGKSGDDITYNNDLSASSYLGKTWDTNLWELKKSTPNYNSQNYQTEGYYTRSWEATYTSQDSSISFSRYSPSSGYTTIAIGKLFGLVGGSGAEVNQSMHSLEAALSKTVCDAPTAYSEYYGLSSNGCIGFNKNFLNGYTVQDSAGVSHTLRGYTVANNFAVTSNTDFPLVPSSTALQTGYSDPANHVAVHGSSNSLFGNLSGGLGLVSQMVTTDLSALSTDPATQQALVALGQSLISSWTDVRGAPVLTTQTLNAQPSSTCEFCPSASVGSGGPGSTTPLTPNTGLGKITSIVRDSPAVFAGIAAVLALIVTAAISKLVKKLRS
ncbi:MAG: hypothetical protein LBH36_02950 [Candidatus Nomurabacteria bacterium]|nr:hypothetical protein [Candidatus Nomurabacteria bacterium]